MASVAIHVEWTSSIYLNQPALIASTGQVLSHAPQSVQLDASIKYLLSPALIASTGQTLSQAPHIVHSSEIT